MLLLTKLINGATTMKREKVKNSRSRKSYYIDDYLIEEIEKTADERIWSSSMVLREILKDFFKREKRKGDQS